MRKREVQSLKRLGKLLTAAVIPVIIASLQQGEVSLVAIGMGIAIPALGAILKWGTWVPDEKMLEQAKELIKELEGNVAP